MEMKFDVRIRLNEVKKEISNKISCGLKNFRFSFLFDRMKKLFGCTYIKYQEG